jgi:hypothetical protein
MYIYTHVALVVSETGLRELVSECVAKPKLATYSIMSQQALVGAPTTMVQGAFAPQAAEGEGAAWPALGGASACRRTDNLTKKRNPTMGPTPWLARRFQGKGESAIYISIHMRHAVVVIESRCELVLDFVHAVHDACSMKHRHAGVPADARPACSCRRTDKLHRLRSTTHHLSSKDLHAASNTSCCGSKREHSLHLHLLP